MPEQPSEAQQSGHYLAAATGPPDRTVHDEEVEHPTKLLRIAGMVQSMLAEVHTTDLDQAGRQRLTDIFNRMIAALREVVSEELRDELSEFTLVRQDEVPTASELRIVQAQLSGWLQGLFHGIQASIATQQLEARQQALRALEDSSHSGPERRPGEPPPADPGQYL